MAHVSSIALQPRDKALLCGLFESRVLTSAHAVSLYFGGRRASARKRLQKLKAAKLISERPRKPFEASILHLTSSGIEALASTGAVRNYPRLSKAKFTRRVSVSALTLRHELAVMDAKVAFARAASKAGVSMRTFTTWPLLHEFRVQRTTVKPDAYFRAVPEHGGAKDTQDFYVEIDRSTESLTALLRRAILYRAHSHETRHPFRVLYVFQTDERQRNFLNRLLSLKRPILTQAWTTTVSMLLSSPFGAIWSRPIDVRTSPAPEKHFLLASSNQEKATH